MFKRKRPSDILINYISGKGRGDEIDDYVHSKLTDIEEREVVTPLMDISRKYANTAYVIGISNPESFDEIAALARHLKEIGL